MATFKFDDDDIGVEHATEDPNRTNKSTDGTNHPKTLFENDAIATLPKRAKANLSVRQLVALSACELSRTACVLRLGGHR